MKKFTEWLLETVQPCGECFQYAYKLFKELAEKGEDAALVHGTVTHPLEKKQTPHAWVVWRGDVYDWQSGGKRSSRRAFNALWKPTVTKSYLSDDLPQVIRLLVKSRHYGPWGP